MKKVHRVIEEIYRDYFNEFLTVPLFAEYYGFDIEFATKLLEIGRKLNHMSYLRDTTSDGEQE